MSALENVQEQLRRSGVGRWFHGRELNEQRIILGLAALVVVSLLWVAVWKPVSDWREISVLRQNNAQNLSDWLKANEANAKQAANRSQGNSRSLTPLITKAAAAHEITVNRLQPESNGVVSVVLQQQSFNKIVSWITQLQENNGVTVERASIDQVDAPGYVNAQIRLN